jgi:hypothetical protein
VQHVPQILRAALAEDDRPMTVKMLQKTLRKIPQEELRSP